MSAKPMRRCLSRRQVPAVPIVYSVVCDVSKSMHVSERTAMEAEIVCCLVSHTLRPCDFIEVYRYGEHADSVIGRTEACHVDAAKLRRDVALVEMGRTALYDTTASFIQAMSTSVNEKNHHQRVLIVLTDGNDNASKEHDPKSLRKLILNSRQQNFHILILGLQTKRKNADKLQATCYHTVAEYRSCQTISAAMEKINHLTDYVYALIQVNKVAISYHYEINEVALTDTANPIPILYTLICDISDSIHTTGKINVIIDTVNKILTKVLRKCDYVEMVTYGSQVKKRFPLAQGQNVKFRHVQNFLQQKSDRSALFDAIGLTLATINCEAKFSHYPKIIVVLTDCEDNYSNHFTAESLKLALETSRIPNFYMLAMGIEQTFYGAQKINSTNIQALCRAKTATFTTISNSSSAIKQMKEFISAMMTVVTLKRLTSARDD